MVDQHDIQNALRATLPSQFHPEIPGLTHILLKVLDKKTSPITTADEHIQAAFRQLQGQTLNVQHGPITMGNVNGNGIAIGHGSQTITIAFQGPQAPNTPPSRNEPLQFTHALHQLRAPIGDFVGRENEIDKLIQALTSNNRAASISGIRGMAGIGKTELAYVVANRVKDHFPDAQIVIDLRGSVNGRSLKPEHALHIVVRSFFPLQPPPDDPQQLLGLYHSLLSEKRVLILADDVLNAGQVRLLLPPAGSALLMTSRHKIDLPNIAPANLAALPMHDAVALLLKICPRIGTFAHKLADLCGCLPLALRVSATLLQSRPMRDVEGYLQTLEAEHERLKHLRTSDDPLLDVEASLNLSYAALDAAAQTALRQLGVFTSQFDITAAQAVVVGAGHQNTTALLEQLYMSNLLEYNEDSGRCELHSLVRVFALVRLREAGEEQATRLRHAGYYATFAKDLQQRFNAGGEQVRVALQLFDRERPRISSGWRWAREYSPPTPETDRLLIAYGSATMNIGDLRYYPRQDRIPQYEAMLAAARRLGSRQYEGMALHTLGRAYAALGEYRQAIDLYTQYLTIAQEIGNHKCEGIALGSLGNMHAELGSYLQAVLLHRHNLDIAREIGNRKGESIALGNLGYALTLSGEPDQAIQHHKQQLEIIRQHNYVYEYGVALSNR